MEKMNLQSRTRTVSLVNLAISIDQNYGYDSGSEDDDRNLNNDNYGSKEPSDPTSERKYDYDDYNRESSENKGKLLNKLESNVV